MGKTILLVLAILLSLGTAVGGYLLSSKKSQFSSQLVAVETALRNAESISYNANYLTNPNEPAASVGAAAISLQNATEELTTTKGNLEQTTSQLANRTAEVQELKTNLTSTQRDLEEVQTKLTSTEEKLAPLQEENQKVEQLLGGRDLEKILADLSKIQEDFEVIQAEKRVIEDILADKSEQLADLEQLMDMGKRGVAPLDLSGKVLAINRAWNFVVLDVGRDDDLPEGVELTVYRGENLVGKVRTVAVDPDTAIADIVPEWTQGEIQVGDQVLF